MGNPFVPSLPNLFMTQFEEKYIYDSSINPFYMDIIFYKHFMNDIIVLFAYSNKVQAFFSWINSLHSTIKFTCHHDEDTSF